MTCRFCKEVIEERDTPFSDTDGLFHVGCHALVRLIKEKPLLVKEWLKRNN